MGFCLGLGFVGFFFLFSFSWIPPLFYPSGACTASQLLEKCACVTVRQKGEQWKKIALWKLMGRGRERTDVSLLPVSLAMLDLLRSTGSLLFQLEKQPGRLGFSFQQLSGWEEWGISRLWQWAWRFSWGNDKGLSRSPGEMEDQDDGWWTAELHISQRLQECPLVLGQVFQCHFSFPSNHNGAHKRPPTYLFLHQHI